MQVLREPVGNTAGVGVAEKAIGCVHHGLKRYVMHCRPRPSNDRRKSMERENKKE